MSDKTRQGDDFNRDEQTMARLLRLAGPRDPIPGDVEARVYERVQEEWRASSERPDGSRVYPAVHRQWAKHTTPPRARRWFVPVAVAASVVVALAIVLSPSPPAPVSIPVGTIARVVAGNDAGSLPTTGQEVYVGDRLSTGPGQGLSLRLSNLESLRIDEQTVLVVQTDDAFELLQGRVYADTGDIMFKKRQLVIETSLGSVTDVGTQFSVAAGDDRIDVAVREGRVDVSQDAESLVAVAGERLQVHRDAAAVYDTLAPHDPYWDWATQLAPAFDIENKSLLDFLRWAARETGRELVFADNELRMAAMRTDLHGSIDDIEPIEAMKAVLATTQFRYRVEANRIFVDR